MISGLARWRSWLSTLMVMTRIETSTWGAASPTPGAATIVSIISSIRRRIESSTLPTLGAFRRRTGLSSATVTILRRDISCGSPARSHDRVDVDAPAPAPGQVGKRPLDLLPPHRELPSVLAAKALQEGGRRTEDVEPATPAGNSREPVDGLLSGGLRRAILGVTDRAGDQPRVRGEAVGPPHPDLVVREAAVVVSDRVADGVVVGAIGLEDHSGRLVAPPRPAGHLGDQGEGHLSAPVVGEMERGVGVDDPDQADPPQVPALGDHLSADQAVRLAGPEALVDLEVGVPALDRVPVHPEQPQPREPLRHLRLQPLRPHPESTDCRRAAAR